MSGDKEATRTANNPLRVVVYDPLIAVHAYGRPLIVMPLVMAL